MTRLEKDSIGELKIPVEALFGIHSLRAKHNFLDDAPLMIEWYKAVGLVKKSFYLTYRRFKKELSQKYPQAESQLNLIDDIKLEALIEAADQVILGNYFDQFIVPAISGGAGTSINMNVNEIIANLALRKLGLPLGAYKHLDPIEHANVFQSTNDVIPTALKVAIILQLAKLEEAINVLRREIEQKENQYRNVLRTGYTQMQEAVPSSYGKLFSCYQESLARDWWRISKCFERIKVVNIGGSAIGTGITVPRFFIFEVINDLRNLINHPIARADNLQDATSNLDSIVEVHSVLKIHASNLEKMGNDLRLLASDFHGKHHLAIPEKQVGSSIMPGKINPVIVEYIVACAHQVYANDQIVTNLSAQGALDLNANLPLIGHAILRSLQLLIGANLTAATNLWHGLYVHAEKAAEDFQNSPCISTALVPYLGYNKAGEIAKLMKEENLNIYQANEKLKMVDSKLLEEILRPSNLLKQGYSISDIL